MPTTIDRDVETKPRSFPIARLDLDEEVRRMRASPNTSGHLGKTLLHGPDMRLVLMILDRGKQLPAHSANGSLAIQTLSGRVIVTLLESSYDLGPGQLLSIERGVSHALVAIEDSAILLTIARQA
jgi:quercetin dioxygenase-like cupin family protein